MKNVLNKPIQPITGSKKGVFDDLLVAREIYNPTKDDCIKANLSPDPHAERYPIEFVRDFTKDEYITLSGISLGPARVVVKPGEWVYLSHFYYTPRCMGGTPTVTITENFGRTIGIGNKLPSAPIPEMRDASDD